MIFKVYEGDRLQVHYLNDAWEPLTGIPRPLGSGMVNCRMLEANQERCNNHPDSSPRLPCELLHYYGLL